MPRWCDDLIPNGLKFHHDIAAPWFKVLGLRRNSCPVPHTTYHSTVNSEFLLLFLSSSFLFAFTEIEFFLSRFKSTVGTTSKCTRKFVGVRAMRLVWMALGGYC